MPPTTASMPPPVETKQRCFVVRPFPARATKADLRWKTIKQCIVNACEERYLIDDTPADLCRDILKGIVTPLLTAPMVIAYLGSGKGSWNPNVMIEVGYRLATGLPLVLICDQDPDRELRLPFDIDKRRMVLLRDKLTRGAIAEA